MMVTIMMSIGGLIVICLAVYAAYLVIKSRGYEKRRLIAEKNQTLRMEEAADTARRNISIMLRVIEQKQVSLTEAAIRIMAYRLALPDSERDSIGYQAFDQLAKATAHIPILGKWKTLSQEEQAGFESERKVLESSHRPAIEEAVLSLQTALSSESEPLSA
ncbi:MAG: DUF2489 domain-containing protein [Oceanicoccus sp.]